MGWTTGVRFPAWCGFLSSSLPRPDRLWGPHSLLTNGYQGLLPRGVKLTTHLHLVRRLRRYGDILPFPQCIFMTWCLLNELYFWTLSIVWCLKKLRNKNIYTKNYTRRWIKSKSTIRSIPTHHRQNPTEITWCLVQHRDDFTLLGCETSLYY
jgi:hypothetical protein